MDLPPDFAVQYGEQLAAVRRVVTDRPVRARLCWDAEDRWPGNAVHFQCAFAVGQLRAARPGSILDIGSLREFVLGLQAQHTVVSVDVRPAKPRLDREPYVIADASRLPFPANSFDAVITLSALEHFGLGRYGDRFDLAADVQAAEEMARVLRPGGTLIVTAVVGAAPAVVFNAHRVYGRGELAAMFGHLAFVDERLMSRRLGRYCAEHELTRDPDDWDFFFGCWRKPAATASEPVPSPTPSCERP